MTDMIIKNKYIYFGAVPADVDYEAPEGWEPGWFYRFVIDAEMEDVHIEEGNRKAIIAFHHIWELSQTVNKVQQEIVCASIGAPLPNA